MRDMKNLTQEERLTLIRARDLIRAKTKGNKAHLFCDEDSGGNHSFDGDWWEAEAEAVIADLEGFLRP